MLKCSDMKKPEYLRHADIDKALWDKCIERAPNSLIYGRSLYLDTLSQQWDALVYDDYRLVMPLPWQKKWGMRYVYQPFFIQQGGIFGHGANLANMTSVFLKAAYQKFGWINVHLNFYNHFSRGLGKTNCVIRPGNFPDVRQHFHKDIIRASRAPLKLVKGQRFAEIISVYQQTTGKRSPQIRAHHYSRFLELCRRLEQEGCAFTARAMDEDLEMLAEAIFFTDRQRVYYMMSCQNAKGRKRGAMAFLLYHMIEQAMLAGKTFDFEGSCIDSVRFFFEKFHTVNEPYGVFKKKLI